MKPLIFILFGVGISATVVASPDPETIVEVSLFDLVSKPPGPRKVRAPRLPADYGNRVARIVAGVVPQLRECLPQGYEPKAYRTSVTISPAGRGRAEAEGTVDEISACLVRILTSLEYPVHPLNRPVVVKLPVQLQRKQP